MASSRISPLATFHCRRIQIGKSPNLTQAYSWENHRTQWGMFPQAMFDCRRVSRISQLCLDMMNHTPLRRKCECMKLYDHKRVRFIVYAGVVQYGPGEFMHFCTMHVIKGLGLGWGCNDVVMWCKTCCDVTPQMGLGLGWGCNDVVMWCKTCCEVSEMCFPVGLDISDCLEFMNM